MSLDNLLKISQLQRHAATAQEVQRLLAAASRNLNDYSGDLIEPAAVRSCVSHAQSLLNTTRRWLSEHRPDLFNQTP